MNERPDHTHLCRDCGEEIPCDGDGETCWEGGNSGCPRCGDGVNIVQEPTDNRWYVVDHDSEVMPNTHEHGYTHLYQARRAAADYGYEVNEVLDSYGERIN